ncbi:MAG: hypothetical protein F4X06_13555, partial [Gammaproteobacteria bacterium]|nr:hypothetical protein [Gammaproteobacteria bacterium]
AASAAEGSAVAFTVTLPKPAPSGGVTIGYSTSDGRGVSADATHQIADSADYTAAAEGAAITIPQGDSSGTISIATTQDATYEGDHHFTLTLGTPSHFNLGTATAVGTIEDDADAPTFAFSAASTAATENGGAVTLTVERTGSTLVDATVSYATKDGTATGGSDFTAIASTSLEFKVADTNKAFTVTVTDDTDDEPTEGFTVELSNPSDAKLGAQKSHSITITDDDKTTVALSAPSGDIAENGGSKVVTVTLGRALTGTETLAVPLTFTGAAAFGADYALAAPSPAPTGVTYSNLASTDRAANPPTIAFSGVAGAASSAAVTLTATTDAIDEGASESVTVGIGTITTAPDGGATATGTSTFNITDDDKAPTGITLTASPDSADEDGAAVEVTVTAAVTGTTAYAEDKTVKVSVGANTDSATEATDYDTVADFDIAIDAGQTSASKSFTLTPKQDDLAEGAETITVGGAAGNGVTVSGDTITINDDETTPTVTLKLASATINESGGTTASAVTAELSGKSSEQVTVTVSLPAGAPATLSDDKVLTIAAGKTTSTGTVTITAKNDDVANGSRTVTVSGTASGGGVADPTGVTLTVADDESAPTVTLKLAPAKINEAAPGNASTVTATLSGKSSEPVTVTVSLPEGAKAALSGNKVLTIAAGVTTSAGTVAITAANDDLDHPNREVAVSGEASGGGVAGPDDVTLTIEDDETTPTVSLHLDPATINESGNNNASTVTATLSGKSEEAVTVTVSLPDGAPAALGDNADLTIAAGATTSSGTVTVTATDNQVDAADATVKVKGAATGGHGVASPTDATLTIKDDDTAPMSLALTVDADKDTAGPQSSVAEDGGAKTARVTATLAGSTTFDAAAEVTVTVGKAGDAATSTDYTASLASFTITIPAGKSSAHADFTLTPTNDKLDENDEALTLTGSAGSLTVSDATIKITDDDDPPALSIADAAVTEGGQATFTITLTPVSGRDVTVRWATAADADGTNPATAGDDYTAVPATTANIAAGQTKTTARVDTTADKVDEANETFLVNLSSPGNATLATADATATGTITDDDAAPKGITLTASPDTLTENGGAVSVTVTAAVTGGTTYGAATEVAVQAGASDDSAEEGKDYYRVDDFKIDIPAGNTSATHTFTLTPKQDAVAEGSETITVSGSAGQTVSVTADEITLTDDEALPVATLNLSPSTINESGTGNVSTVTASLDRASSAETTITVSLPANAPATLSSNKALTIAAGATASSGVVTVTATDNKVDAADATVNVQGTASGGHGIANPTAAALTVKDNDTRGLVFSKESLGVTEGGQGSYTVALNSQPTAEVTVTVSGHDGTDLTLDKTSLTFTTSNWSTAQTVTVTAGQDDDAGNDAVTLIHAASGGDYGSVSADLKVAVTDDESPGIVLSPASLTVNEGASGSYTVALATQPSAEVTVTISGHDGTDLTPNKTSLTFTRSNWSAAQTVNLGAGQDDDAGNDTATLTHDASGGDYADVSANLGVTVNDDDTAAITLTPASLTVNEGASGSYTVALATQPSAEVTVTISGHDGTDLTPNKTSLTFTRSNWSAAQTVNLGAGQDDDAGNDAATLVHAASGGDYADVSSSLAVTVTDDDTAGIVLDPADGLAVDEGGSGSYTVALGTEPSGTVTVKVTGQSGTGLTLDSASLTFTASNWAEAQTVNVSAGQDDDAGDDTVTLTHTASGGGYADLSAALKVTVDDDETAALTLTPGAVTVAEPSGTAAYTVALAARPSGAVTVALASSDKGAATVSPAELTFTASNYANAQNVTVTAVDDKVDNTGDKRAAAIGHTASGGGYADVTGSVAVTVTDDDTAPTSLTLAVDADTAKAGPQAAVTEDGGAKTARVTATLGGTTTFDEATEVTVTVGKAGDAAVKGTDYTAP